MLKTRFISTVAALLLTSILTVSLSGAPIAAMPNIAITSGPVAYQVLQRESSGTASLRFSGTASDANGKNVEARVLRKGLPLESLDWKAIGNVNGSRWNGEISSVPTGGPYRVELRLADQTGVTAIENILVGDLWILAGQSNMQGVGKLVNLTAPRELIHSFELNDSWRIAEDPLHNYGDAVDPVHWRHSSVKSTKPLEGQELINYARRPNTAGLGMPFAATMLERTGVPIGLLPCAFGGASMDQWNPANADKGGDSLYGSMLRRFRAVGGQVKGVLWYQGESDVSAASSIPFASKFENFVAAVRRDFNQPNLPFYYVQIGRFVNPGGEEGWNHVQNLQLQAESKIGTGGMTTSVDLSLEDAIHLDTASHKRLGTRLANLICHDLFPNLAEFQTVKRGPRPVSAILKGNIVHVTFSQVNGSLRAAGRPSGFSVHNAAGDLLPIVIKTEFAPDGKTALISINPFNLPNWTFPTDMALRYGYGKDPYCNVSDALDMALPAFGPLTIQKGTN